jgi:tRNA (cytidine/uridine-2'-O-)-methyltransferase
VIKNALSENQNKAPLCRVVLVNPVIPQNTGNIGRLTAALCSELHLIEPLGFSLDDKYMKRAGLDYWPEVALIIHKNWEDFIKQKEPNKNLWLFTTKAEKSYFDVQFSTGDYLVFGNEASGLSKEFHEKYFNHRVKIPMDNPKIRSLNLSNSVSAVVFEVKRQHLHLSQ